MSFFDGVPKQPEPTFPARERRAEQRFPIPPSLPLKASLRLIGRDDTGAPMSNSRHNWHWKGRLLDFSGEGARVQMGPGVRTKVGDTCDLMLTLEFLEVIVPSEIANVREEPEGTVVGLKHRIEDESTWREYKVLLEAVALGSTLEVQFRHDRADEYGFLVEQYASPWGSRLTVWREPAARRSVAFEMVLNDGLIRAAQGEDAEYLAGADSSAAQPAERDLANETYRLFHWVVPCLSPVVPEDVRGLLQRYA